MQTLAATKNRLHVTSPDLAVIEAAEPASRDQTSGVVQWRKGWTPWGTPCSVLVVDGFAYAAHASEQHDCPIARLAD